MIRRLCAAIDSGDNHANVYAQKKRNGFAVLDCSPVTFKGPAADPSNPNLPVAIPDLGAGCNAIFWKHASLFHLHLAYFDSRNKNPLYESQSVSVDYGSNKMTALQIASNGTVSVQMPSSGETEPILEMIAVKPVVLHVFSADSVDGKQSVFPGTQLEAGIRSVQNILSSDKSKHLQDYFQPIFAAGSLFVNQIMSFECALVNPRPLELPTPEIYRLDAGAEEMKKVNTNMLLFIRNVYASGYHVRHPSENDFATQKLKDGTYRPRFVSIWKLESKPDQPVDSIIYNMGTSFWDFIEDFPGMNHVLETPLGMSKHEAKQIIQKARDDLNHGFQLMMPHAATVYESASMVSRYKKPGTNDLNLEAVDSFVARLATHDTLHTARAMLLDKMIYIHQRQESASASIPPPPPGRPLANQPIEALQHGGFTQYVDLENVTLNAQPIEVVRSDNLETVYSAYPIFFKNYPLSSATHFVHQIGETGTGWFGVQAPGGRQFLQDVSFRPLDSTPIYTRNPPVCFENPTGSPPPLFDGCNKWICIWTPNCNIFVPAAIRTVGGTPYVFYAKPG